MPSPRFHQSPDNHLLAPPSNSTASACKNAVLTYADILSRRHSGEASRSEALDEWTNYVNAVGQTAEGHNDDVAMVLSILYNCLSVSGGPPSTEASPLGSSAHLHALDDSSHESRSPGLRSIRGLRGLRNGTSPASLSAAAVAAGGGNSPQAPVEEANPNPRRSSFRTNGSNSNSAAQLIITRAPGQDSLIGGLDEKDCEGFKLE